MSSSRTTPLAALMWSSLIWSTVALKSCGLSSEARRLDRLPDRLAAPPLVLAGVEFPDLRAVPLRLLAELPDLWKICDVRGLTRSEVEGPGVTAGDTRLKVEADRSEGRGRRASRAARRRRLVVPVDLDSPDRAEQTTATRLPESM